MLEISQTGNHSKTFDKHWKNPVATGKPFYEIEHVEIVCRDLIDIAEMLHTESPATLPIFDKEALKTAAQSKRLTFQELFELMIKLVLDSKTLCDALMRGEKHATFVACTPQMWKNTGYNRKANESKKELLKMGYEQRDKVKMDNEVGAEDKHEQGGEKMSWRSKINGQLIMPLLRCLVQVKPLTSRRRGARTAMIVQIRRRLTWRQKSRTMMQIRLLSTARRRTTPASPQMIDSTTLLGLLMIL